MSYYMLMCSTFRPQIKGIPESTFVMHNSTPKMYSGKVVLLPKEQATCMKASIALVWIRCLCFFYSSSDKKKIDELMLT